jgi:hypothetical protein
VNHQIKAVSFERVCATLLWSTSGETHGPTRIRDHVTFPYLDREKLLEECLQIVREHFRRLRYNPLYRLPHSKAIVSQPNSERFDIYFPGSRRWLSPAATPNAFTLAMLYHYRGVSIRVALWSQLLATQFFELLLDVESSGVTLVCCHEHHAVLQFHACERVEGHRSRKE